MLFCLELKKLLMTPSIICFIIICLALNAVIAIAGYSPLETQSNRTPENVFEGYSANSLAEWHIRKHGITESNAVNVRAKYEKLQPVIDKKARDGDALSLYFGEMSYYKHSQLFGSLFKAMIAEGCLIALFFALLSITYENAKNTAQIVYSSKAGRPILLIKLAASLTAAILSNALVLAFGLLAFVARFDMRGVWEGNVSSGYNYAMGLYGIPFITWHSFTFASYLLATILASLLLFACFTLLGFGIGVLAHKDFVAVIASISIIIAMAFIGALFPAGSVIKSALSISPVGLWQNSGAWFTDGGANIIWANFEAIGLSASLALLSAAAIIIAKTFKKRDLL